MKNFFRRVVFKKNKEVLGSWTFFLFSIYFIDGMDAILRLKNGGWLGTYTELGVPIHSVTKDGLPDWLLVMMTCIVMGVAIYCLCRSLVIRGWKDKNLKKRILGILFFSLHFCFAFVVYVLIGWSYVLGTGIDSI
ncbi:hypothetical protein HOH45_02205 [bacterium]|jgi:hypothetical protein|nr:hypothetical protein [bacterium]